MFFYLWSKHRLWVCVSEAVLTRTHDQCFRANIKKNNNVYPCKMIIWKAQGVLQ